MTEEEEILRWWDENPTRQEIISMNSLEKTANVPRGTFQYFLKRKRGLPRHHLDNLVKMLELVGYQPVTNDHRFL